MIEQNKQLWSLRKTYNFTEVQFKVDISISEDSDEHADNETRLSAIEIARRNVIKDLQ